MFTWIKFWGSNFCNFPKTQKLEPRDLFDIYNNHMRRTYFADLWNFPVILFLVNTNNFNGANVKYFYGSQRRCRVWKQYFFEIVRKIMFSEHDRQMFFWQNIKKNRSLYKFCQKGNDKLFVCEELINLFLLPSQKVV